MDNVTPVKHALISIRKDTNYSLKNLKIKNVSKLVSVVRFEIKIPRTCYRQTKRVIVSYNILEENLKYRCL